MAKVFGATLAHAMMCVMGALLAIGLALCSAQAETQLAATTMPLANGAELHRGALVMRVVALRDDIIRVRIGPAGTLPEDASWAVLAEARAAIAPVRQTADGFSTPKLSVSINRETMALVVRDAAGKLISADVPDAPFSIAGKRFTLHKQLADGARVFGLGDKTAGLDRRGHSFTMWNTDAYGFGDGGDAIYKSIPFFLAGNGADNSYGILLDNSFRSSFDMGQSDPATLAFGAPDGPIDYYIILGPHPKQVLAGYAFLTGTAPMPPRWALGFQQSRYSYMSAARVREVAGTYRKLKIPADAIYLDIDYQDRNRPFTTNATTFPKFKGLMGNLTAQGFHAVTIVDLHVAAARDQGYAPYDSGVAGDHFLRRSDGTLYVGKVWPGDSVFPDFTRAKTRAWYGTLYKNFMADGVSGIWNDMNEPAIFERLDKTMPADVVHRIDEPGFETRNASHAEGHNIFGMQNSRATFDGLTALAPDERPFVLTRASYAGGQRYAFTWTGDNQATWEHLRLATPQLLSLGLSGFPFVGVDIGGYSGSPTPELLTRWTQIHAFTPMMRYHAESGSRDKEVWVHGAQHTDIRRRFIEERYRLMPYLYTLADEATRTGVPIMRPVFLEFPEQMGAVYNQLVDNAQSFMVGDAVLVATPDIGGSITEYRYDIRLPKGGWYDYWSGLRLASNTVNAKPGLATLPVFVRAGSIIPRQPVIQHEGEVPQGPLVLHVYPGPECHGALYTDDGHSLAYKKGAYLRQQFTCVQGKDGVTVHIGAREGSFVPWWKSIAVVVHDWAPLTGAARSGQRYDPAAHTITTRIDAGTAARDVTFVR